MEQMFEKCRLNSSWSICDQSDVQMELYPFASDEAKLLYWTGRLQLWHAGARSTWSLMTTNMVGAVDAADAAASSERLKLHSLSAWNVSDDRVVKRRKRHHNKVTMKGFNPHAPADRFGLGGNGSG